MGTLYVNGVPLTVEAIASNLEYCDGCGDRKPVSKGAYKYLPSETGVDVGDPFIWLCYPCHDGYTSRD